MPEITDHKSFRLFHNATWSVVAIMLMLFVLTLDYSYEYLSAFQNIFLVLFFGVLIIGLVSFARTFSRFGYLTKAVFIFHALVSLIIGILHHPGLMNDDTFILMDVLSKNNLTTWSSIGYSLFTSLFYKYDKSFFSQSVVQLLMYLVCVYSSLRIFEVRTPLRAVLLAACAMFPLIHATNLYVTRDNIMALITTYGVLICINQRINSKTSDFFFLIKVAVVIFISSVFKQDGLVLIASFPVLLVILKNFSLKEKFAATAILWTMASVWHFSLYKKNILETSQLYQLTGIVHTLNYIVNTQDSNISNEDKEIIKKIVDYDYLVKNYNSYSIDPFHLGKFYLPVAESEWAAFLKTYRKLILQFPGAFLEERLEVFSIAMNIGATPFIFPDQFDSAAENSVKIKQLHGMSRWNLFPELKNKHLKFLENFCMSHKPDLSNLYKLFGTPIFLLLSAIAYILRARNRIFYGIFASAFAFSLSRLAPVFLLAPEPQMKYYSFLIYASFFFLIVATTFSKNDLDKLSNS